MAVTLTHVIIIAVA